MEAFIAGVFQFAAPGGRRGVAFGDRAVVVIGNTAFENVMTDKQGAKFQAVEHVRAIAGGQGIK